MKTSGMFILNLTPPLGKKASGLAGRGYALRIVVLYPKKRREEWEPPKKEDKDEAKQIQPHLGEEGPLRQGSPS